MNLLIIEDDLFLANKMKEIFQKKNFINRVNLLLNFDDFLKEFYLLNTYDIILVDILLWSKSNNWIDIIKKIRTKNIDIPIIVISWLNEIWWLKVAFEWWANDYIYKPFRIAELEVRILKWFNKFLYNKIKCKDFIEYNWLKYYFNNNSFFLDNEEIVLTKKNKYLLLLFISNPENLLTNLFLIEKMWWDSNLLERNIRVSIVRLKRNLKKYKIDNWIRNIRGEWYMLKK